MPNNELYHYGVLGMRWGVRRYQNEDGTLTAAGKRKYLSKMKKDQDQYFKSKISSEAAKVTNIGRNGYDVRGSRWNDAYRKGQVSEKDDRQIKSAARETRAYMREKYGESAVKALARSGVLSKKVGDFEIKRSIDLGKSIVESEAERNGRFDRLNRRPGVLVDGANVPNPMGDRLRKNRQY